MQTPFDTSAFSLPGVPTGSVSPVEFLPKLQIPIRVGQLQRVKERTLSLSAPHPDSELTPCFHLPLAFAKPKDPIFGPFLRLCRACHLISHQWLFLQAFCPFIVSSALLSQPSSIYLLSCTLVSHSHAGFITIRFFYYNFSGVSLGWQETD